MSGPGKADSGAGIDRTQHSGGNDDRKRAHRSGHPIAGNPPARSEARSKPASDATRVEQALELDDERTMTELEARIAPFGKDFAAAMASAETGPERGAAMEASMKKILPLQQAKQQRRQQALALLDGINARYTAPGTRETVGAIRTRLQGKIAEGDAVAAMGNAALEYVRAVKARDNATQLAARQAGSDRVNSAYTLSIQSFDNAARMFSAVQPDRTLSYDPVQAAIYRDDALGCAFMVRYALLKCKIDQAAPGQSEAETAWDRYEAADTTGKASLADTTLKKINNTIQTVNGILKLVDAARIAYDHAPGYVRDGTAADKQQLMATASEHRIFSMTQTQVALTVAAAPVFQHHSAAFRQQGDWLAAHTSKWNYVVTACFHQRQLGAAGKAVHQVLERMPAVFEELHSFYRYQAWRCEEESRDIPGAKPMLKYLNQLVLYTEDLRTRIEAELGAMHAHGLDLAATLSPAEVDAFILAHTPRSIQQLLEDNDAPASGDVDAYELAATTVAAPVEPAHMPDLAALAIDVVREEPVAADATPAIPREKRARHAGGGSARTGSRPAAGPTPKAPQSPETARDAALASLQALGRDTVAKALEWHAQSDAHLRLADSAETDGRSTVHDVYLLSMQAVMPHEKAARRLGAVAERWEKLIDEYARIESPASQEKSRAQWRAQGKLFGERAAQAADKAAAIQAGALAKKIELVKQRPPTESGFDFLRRHNELADVQATTDRLPSNDDFISEYLIHAKPLRRGAPPIEWGAAHFHYATRDAPVLDSTAHHLKSMHARGLGPQAVKREAEAGRDLTIHRAKVRRDLVTELEQLRTAFGQGRR